MKEKYFQYIIEHRNFWCHGFTLKRLDKVKDKVLNNKDIMWDLFDRHNITVEPEILKENDPATFDHAIGNFVTSILYTMMDEGILKR